MEPAWRQAPVTDQSLQDHTDSAHCTMFDVTIIQIDDIQNQIAPPNYSSREHQDVQKCIAFLLYHPRALDLETKSGNVQRYEERPHGCCKY